MVLRPTCCVMQQPPCAARVFATGWRPTVRTTTRRCTRAPCFTAGITMLCCHMPVYTTVASCRHFTAADASQARREVSRPPASERVLCAGRRKSHQTCWSRAACLRANRLLVPAGSRAHSALGLARAQPPPFAHPPLAPTSAPELGGRPVTPDGPPLHTPRPSCPHRSPHQSLAALTLQPP